MMPGSWTSASAWAGSARTRVTNIADVLISMPDDPLFPPAAGVSMLGQGVLERVQGLLARRRQGWLLVQRQRQGTHVGVAAGQGDDLGVDGHEPVEGGSGGGEPRPGRCRKERGECRQRVSCRS